MSNKLNLTKIFMGIFVLVLFAVPRLSYADWGNHHGGGRSYHYHDHPHYGIHVSFLPAGYFSLWIGGARYYYYDGLYYSYIDGGYVIVAPPAGAVVSAIPTDFQPVLINGVTYYVNNGTYYLYTSHGYQVVPAPATIVQPAGVVTTQAVTTVVTTPTPGVGEVTQDTFTLNIPNNSGGYTAVVIKRSGNGYVGPQGEFYSEFPKVSQLKVMYGR